MTLLWVNNHAHQVMQLMAPKLPSSPNSVIKANIFAAGLKETHQTLGKTLQEAQANQTKYTSGKEVVI
jgi:hypothetical protein